MYNRTTNREGDTAVTTLTIHGLAWHAHSPSMFKLAHVQLWVAFSGTAWYVGHTEAMPFWGRRSFRSRDEAMQLVVEEFSKAAEALS